MKEFYVKPAAPETKCGSVVPSRQGPAEVFHVGLPTSSLVSTGGRNQPGPAILLSSVFPQKHVFP